MDNLFDTIIPIVAANGYGKEVASCITVNKYLHKHPYLLNALFKLKNTRYPWTGDTILHRLAKHGNHHRIQDYIEAGVNLEARNYEGDTPLFCVVRNIAPDKHKYYETAKLLLRSGANPSVIGPYSTLIGIAVAFEDITMLEILCHAGADVNLIHESEGKNMLSVMTAPRQSRLQLSPVAEAVCRNNLAILKLLIQYGANLSYVSGDDSTTLITLAAKYNHCEILKFLMSIGLDVNETRESRTALHVATLSNKIDTANLLLKHGANVNATDKYNTTALMIASVENFPLLVEILLRNGADTKLVQQGTNKTALEMAVLNDHYAVVSVFYRML